MQGNSATKLIVQPTVWKGVGLGEEKDFACNTIVPKDLVNSPKEVLPKDFPLKVVHQQRYFRGWWVPQMRLSGRNMLLLSWYQATLVNVIFIIAIPQ